MEEKKESGRTGGRVKGVSISIKSFATALAMLFLLMVVTYAATFLIPGGEYERCREGSPSGNGCCPRS